MSSSLSPVLLAGSALIVLRALAQFFLEKLNSAHVRSGGTTPPPRFADVMDAGTYARSVHYTLSKSEVTQVEIVWEAAVLLLVLWTGLLPWSFELSESLFGSSAAAHSVYLLGVGVGLSLLDLPLDYYRQFVLEARFGFNTTTFKLWVIDRIKAAVLSVALMFPLIWTILKLVNWAGPLWWLWAWIVLMAFQFTVSLLAPVLILPLFNKLTPLPDGALKDRLLALARQTGFKASAIHVMDGSKRSRHSNAFFTGFGRFRRIVLFDTLVQQLKEQELAAVLAHEIGHYKKRHIPKSLVLSAVGSLVALYAVAWLTREPWFTGGFGFQTPSLAAALLLFALLSGVATFWFSPLAFWWSRKNEYEADAYAAAQMGETGSLVAALRQLSRENLSNLTPHPLYSGFYYSHPTLAERERALGAIAKAH